MPDVPEIVIGLGWEPEQPSGQDADPSAFLLGQDGRVGSDEDFIFYNNPHSTCGSVHLLQGAAPDRQQFRLRLGDIPSRVERIAVCLTLSGGGSFAGAQQLHIRVLDDAGVERLIFRPQTQGWWRRH
ncbi:MAG: TerD family protein [Candidatus Competibacteraceae bacterium]